MAEVRSTFQLKRGSKAPEFQLPEGGGKEVYSLGELMEGRESLVVIFACNHCPYVKVVARYLGDLAMEYSERGVQFVAINPNDVSAKPEDSPKKMAEFAKENEWKFPYLYDETQDVAKAYGAACTPDFFVFNSDLELTYTGQLDGARPGNGSPITGADLRAALESTLRCGSADGVRMRPSSGCSIKWKNGSEPDYAPRS